MVDALNEPGSYLPSPQHQQANIRVPDLPVPPERDEGRSSEPGTGADIAYIPTSQGFLYLMAIMDWHSQYVLAWGMAKHHPRRQMSSRMATAASVGRAVDFTTENWVCVGTTPGANVVPRN